jgi:hypothetical protein
MEINHFYFFDLFRMLLAHKMLKFEKGKAGYNICFLTREFSIQIRYFENKPGDNVLDFNGIYEYKTVERDVVKEQFCYFFKERELDIFHLFKSKKMFDEIDQNCNSINTESIILFDDDAIRLLYMNYLNLKSISKLNKIAPFDDELYIEIIRKYVIPNIVQ